MADEILQIEPLGIDFEQGLSLKALEIYRRRLKGIDRINGDEQWLYLQTVEGKSPNPIQKLADLLNKAVERGTVEEVLCDAASLDLPCNKKIYFIWVR